jgi:hypothetical protein
MASIAAIRRTPYILPMRRQRCRSSVVEHSLGKGEVVSSILTGSTIKSLLHKAFCGGHRRDTAAHMCRTMRELAGDAARF